MQVFVRVLATISILLFSVVIGCKQSFQPKTTAVPGNQPTGESMTTGSPERLSHGDWKLVWGDEFDGKSLDLEKWKFETGRNGWGNNEWQNYTNGDNLQVGDGTLKITAKKIGAGQNPGDYSSTRLNSRRSFTYGRIEIRAKLPENKGPGLWPAIWMLGDNLGTVGWPSCGELDILEYVSYEPDTIHCAIHSKANNHGDGTQLTSGGVKLESAEEEFHIYGVHWTETQLRFYTDDPSNVKLTFDRPNEFTNDNWPFDKPQYLLLNIAVGGSWGGNKGVDDSIFPATMEVDYVRVYQE